MPEAVASPEFVGRHAELAQLQQGLRDALAGRGRLFLISGDPGIGKTHLSGEVARQAVDTQAIVLWGRCWESGGAPSYWPWMQILRSAMDVPAIANAATDSDRAELRRLLGPATEASGPTPVDAEHARFRLFDTIASLFRRASLERPLVLIFDDMHASDRDSLLLLRFLARELGSARWLMVGTYRASEARYNEAVAPVMGDLSRDSVHLPLAGWSAAEVEQYIEATLLHHSPPPESMPNAADLARAAYHASEGNPFFVAEIVRLWAAEGFRVTPESLRIPDQVRVAVRNRLGLLPPEVRELLVSASVLGREFDRRVLERLVEAPRLGDALLLAVRAGTVQELAAARYTFSHALIRDTLYQDLAPSERARWHRAAARAIADVYRSDPDAHLDDIAHHYLEAASDGEVAEAIDWATRAAERAGRMRAFDDAVLQYGRALEALDRCDGNLPEAPHRRCRLLLALGEARNAAGDFKAARETFRAAADLARRLDAVEELAGAALGYGGGWMRQVEPEDVEGAPGPAALGDTQIRLLNEALQALGKEDSPLRARLLARLAVESYFTAPAERRAELSWEAVEVAERCGDRLSLACVLCDAIVAIWHLDTAYERRKMAEQALAIGTELGDPALEGMASAWLVGALFDLGEVDSMERELDHYRRVAEYHRQPMHLWALKHHLAMRALLTGWFDEAVRLMDEASALGEAGRGLAPVVYWYQLRALQRERGQIEELAAGEAMLRWSADSQPTFPELRVELAHLFVLLGRLDDARQEWQRVAARGFRDFSRDQRWANVLCEATEVCVALRDVEAARSLYELLRPYAGFDALGLMAAISWGSIARSVGQLAGVLRNWEAAESAFELALKNNRALRARPWVARTQYDFAMMLLQRAEADPGKGALHAQRARQLLSDARSGAEALGMALLVGRVDEALAGSEEIAAVPAPGNAGIIRRDGDFWSITFGGETRRYKHALGFDYLACLLHHPNTPIHSLDLRAVGDGKELSPAAPPDKQRERVRLLQAELEQAEGDHDIGRAAALRAELDGAISEIEGTMATGARPAEQARVNVKRAIDAAIRRILEDNESLGIQLRNAVRTGTFCLYAGSPWG